jgi:hypothetical protein
MFGGANTGDQTGEELGVDAGDIAVQDVPETGSEVVPVAEEMGQEEEPTVPEPSYVPLYTIPAGTILYHGSKTKETFDPQKITLGDDTLAAFFTPNKRFAADYISGCVGDETGFIHMFKARVPITNIYVISSHNKKDGWNISQLETKFCKGTEYGRLNGVGFFVKDDFGQKFVYQVGEQDDEKQGTQEGGVIPTASEFAICDPSSFLDYISTQRCQSARNLSEPYNFTV